MNDRQGFASIATFTRHHDLQADFYELEVLLPTHIRVPVSNMNLVMDELGLGASGEAKDLILGLADGETRRVPVVVALGIVAKLKQFAE